MTYKFPREVIQVAEAHDLSIGMAFGLGECLNLYYSRRIGKYPPHQIKVLPVQWESRMEERLALPRAQAISEALTSNAYGVMVCTGDWHGIDAIEKWAEDLSLWPLLDGWEKSVEDTATLIEESDGLYRRSYLAFLEEAAQCFNGLEEAHSQLNPIADEWLRIAGQLRAGVSLEKLSTRVLRMALRESRFWGLILDRFGKGI